MLTVHVNLHVMHGGWNPRALENYTSKGSKQLKPLVHSRLTLKINLVATLSSSFQTFKTRYTHEGNYSTA